jgi:hypothetical protein
MATPKTTVYPLAAPKRRLTRLFLNLLQRYPWPGGAGLIWITPSILLAVLPGWVIGLL